MAAHMVLISPMTIAVVGVIAIYLRAREKMLKSLSVARERIELLNVELATAKARGHHLY